MSVKKLHKIESLKLWINELTKMPYNQELLKSYNGDELNRMSLKQLDMLLNYIKATHHWAYNKVVTELKDDKNAVMLAVLSQSSPDTHSALKRDKEAECSCIRCS